MLVITEKMKVGEIAGTWPQTLKIFAHYRLDLCCGGADTLEVVAQKNGLNLGAILEQLNDVAGEPVPVAARG